MDSRQRAARRAAKAAGTPPTTGDTCAYGRRPRYLAGRRFSLASEQTISFLSRLGGAREGDRGPAAEAATRRVRMVRDQIRARGVVDERVLAAMESVPRHLFVPPMYREVAYADQALPIGFGQTISQPYIVAMMTEALKPEPGLAVLEVGTGSGYQAAVLAACGLEVYSVERIPELHELARESLSRAGYLDRVHLRLDDGSGGWPEAAPFPRILVTAAAQRLPDALLAQLAPGGFLVAPVGDLELQTIYRYRRAEAGLEREALEGARFVPLIEEREA